MNHSMYSADQMTHLKIAVIVLVAGIGVAGFGIAVRIKTGDGYIQTAVRHQSESPASRQEICACAAGTLSSSRQHSGRQAIADLAT